MTRGGRSRRDRLALQDRQDAVESLERVDAVEVDRIEESHGHRVVSRLAQGGCDGIKREGQGGPRSGDGFVGKAATRQRFDAGVDSFLGASRIGVDLIDRLNQTSENRCDCVRILLEELRTHYQVRGHELSFSPQVTLVDQDLATALEYQTSGP